MRSAKSFRIVLVTAGNKKNAAQIAEALVASGTAACVNIISNIQSVYSWKGKVEKQNEFLLVIKTRRKSLAQVEQIVHRHHAYEVPEIVSLSLDQGSTNYLRWLTAETGKKGSRTYA